MLNYAIIDNNLADAQMAIGESSNLAQLALTYSYNFEDSKYMDYICILSVVAQIAIDSAKRKFDIDLDKEIKRIKKNMDIKNNKYPLFWLLIQPHINRDRINPKLNCPMNVLFKYRPEVFRNSTETLPMEHFFIKHKLNDSRRKSKKVEEVIEKYSLLLYNSTKENLDEFILREDFNEMIEHIQRIYISKEYLGLFSWLIDRAFSITPAMQRTVNQRINATEKNKSILFKALYEVNPSCFLKCFKCEKGVKKA